MKVQASKPTASWLEVSSLELSTKRSTTTVTAPLGIGIKNTNIIDAMPQ